MCRRANMLYIYLECLNFYPEEIIVLLLFLSPKFSTSLNVQGLPLEINESCSSLSMRMHFCGIWCPAMVSSVNFTGEVPLAPLVLTRLVHANSRECNLNCELLHWLESQAIWDPSNAYKQLHGRQSKQNNPRGNHLILFLP